MATKKRLTKQQREQQEIDKLAARLTDIYSGVNAGEWIEEDNWPTAEQLSYLCPAVRSIFDNDEIGEYVWSAHNLNHWETPSGLAMFLYGNGIRA